MERVHDMGGKTGLGAIEPETAGPVQCEEWEERVLGLFYAFSKPEDWTGDWFRYCRELIPSEQYLSRPYYDQWLQALAAILLNSDQVTLGELVSGHAQSGNTAHPEPQTAQDVARLKGESEKFTRDLQSVPLFKKSDKVRARIQAGTGHTRLPEYVGGKIGTIVRHHGAHVLPDKNVSGESIAQHLYLVEFQSSTLWGDAQDNRDTVLLDMWESYFE